MRCCCSCWRIQSSITCLIWPEVIFCCLYGAGITYLDVYQHIDFGKYKLPDNLLSVLGVATGMLLVFRTNTSYERYYEGRKCWSDVNSNIRSLIRTLWVMMDDEKKNSSKFLVEKISAVNLLIAFDYALKHYLREEYAYEEKDLQPFAGHVPHLYTPTSNQPFSDYHSIFTRILYIKAQKNATGTRIQPKIQSKKLKKQAKKEGASESLEHYTQFGSNIPLEITFHLSSFVKSFKDRGFIDNPTARVADTGISNLVKCLSTLEAIHSTPIPLAYRVHLTHLTWIVLLLLPLHWTQIGWLSVPLIGVASYSMLGILSIGREIEDPFGYDYDDLNLDEFCQLLQREALTIIGRPFPKVDQWIFSKENCPIPHRPDLTALDLVKSSPDEIQQLLYLGQNFKSTTAVNSRGLPTEHDPEFTSDEFSIFGQEI